MERMTHRNPDDGGSGAQRDVCVIVPTLNRAGYLRETLKSLAAQTLRPRIIVLDDASVDETQEVCAEFADLVDYRRNERTVGLFQNWNRGLALVDSRFVAVFHDDDVYGP